MVGSSSKSLEENDAVEIRTTVGEDYECFIPTLLLRSHEDGRKSSDLVDEEILLQPLFTEKPCSIKSEAYWSYELCHNQHIRQFHEEIRLKKSSPVQEFYLGHYDPHSKTQKGVHKENPNLPKTVTLGENSYPYYEVSYVDGTLCDLIQEHRTTTVMYICHEGIGGSIIDVSEVRTCQYQVVFATKFLCSHPLYKQKRAHTNPISCHSKNGSPSKPMALVALEAERKKLQSQSFSNLAALLSDAFKSKLKVNAKRDKDMVIYHVQRDLDSDDTENLGKNMNNEENKEIISTSISSLLDSSNQVPSSKISSSISSSSLSSTHLSTMKGTIDNQVKEFLHGKLCISGNLGWWTHEICFNKFVRQYHEDVNSKKSQEIHLGNWDLDEHMKWVTSQNLNQKQSSNNLSDRQISLYYGNGDVCKETGKPRETIVKLKCLPSGDTGIYLSFSEPKKCTYSMLVENSIFCDIIPLADDMGILPLEKI
ncbi:unnamed protein product [Heterobilharzia americana]|nr:unnamed protein product [Heterobilharzia americana]